MRGSPVYCIVEGLQNPRMDFDLSTWIDVSSDWSKKRKCRSDSCRALFRCYIDIGGMAAL